MELSERLRPCTTAIAALLPLLAPLPATAASNNSDLLQARLFPTIEEALPLKQVTSTVNIDNTECRLRHLGWRWLWEPLLLLPRHPRGSALFPGKRH